MPELTDDLFDFQRRAVILRAVGLAQAADEALDLDDLAAQLGTSTGGALMEVEQLEYRGLISSGLGEGFGPMLFEAGRQYLDLGGEVSEDVLLFLPRVIDDLHAREALLSGGQILVDEFRHAVVGGDALDHARDLVPPAFVEAVDEPIALNLYAATVALMVRLSDGRPAGCVAEEIMAVWLIEEAKGWLDMRKSDRELTEAEEGRAADELRGLFELFEDDDVLDLFRMSEPADAALAQHDTLKQMMGVVDQRVEAWFKPFGGVSPTGYLADRTKRDGDT